MVLTNVQDWDQNGERGVSERKMRAKKRGRATCGEKRKIAESLEAITEKKYVTSISRVNIGGGK